VKVWYSEDLHIDGKIILYWILRKERREDVRWIPLAQEGLVGKVINSTPLINDRKFLHSWGTISC
jgi:hypothetical protein